MATKLTTLEMCAGAGGQALGLEYAGVEHAALVEIDRHCCQTLRFNRPGWNVIQGDLEMFDPSPFRGVDLVTGGLPCPPFSVAGKQLGPNDERNLFPAALNIIRKVKPRAVMIENVRGILDAIFDDYRHYIAGQLPGYWTDWKLLNASDFGVPQLRPRVIFVALQERYRAGFFWPDETCKKAPDTVGEVLKDLMAEDGWLGAAQWAENADEIAPTVVGGSRKHGGPDLGPTRAKRAWASLGVDGMGIADGAPPRNFVGMPRLTVRMVARLQGFPDSWQFSGGKTASYRQVGNAFPPPVAHAVASKIVRALSAARVVKISG